MSSDSISARTTAPDSVPIIALSGSSLAGVFYFFFSINLPLIWFEIFQEYYNFILKEFSIDTSELKLFYCCPSLRLLFLVII